MTPSSSHSAVSVPSYELVHGQGDCGPLLGGGLQVGERGSVEGGRDRPSATRRPVPLKDEEGVSVCLTQQLGWRVHGGDPG